jgi:8-oxo-dGTP diphosphatase
MRGFKAISHNDITNSLDGVTRQYLTGNLKKPQVLQHIHDENVEIGVTSYPKATAEEPHYHTVATEYQYVISGQTTYYNVETKEEETYYSGDFYVIYPNTIYAQKSTPGTTIIFIKIPSINDKMSIEKDLYTDTWYNK